MFAFLITPLLVLNQHIYILHVLRQKIKFNDLIIKPCAYFQLNINKFYLLT